MDIFIIALIFLAALHFVYEGILLPTIRDSLRNKLFRLRDELRMLKIRGDEASREEAFNILHEGINNFLHNLPYLTRSFQKSFNRRYEKNAELRTRVEKRIAILEGARSPELQRIFKESNSVLSEAFAANMGGWFIYIVPIALFVVSIQKMARLVLELIALPNATAQDFLPQTSRAVTA